MLEEEKVPSDQRKDIPRTPIELILSSLILLIFIVLSFLQVGFRYVLAFPLSWTEELSSLLLIWMTFLGSTAVARRQGRHGHVRLELIEDILGKRLVGWLYVSYEVVIIVFLISLIVGGWEMMAELGQSRTPALRVPFTYVFSIVPISAFLMTIYYTKAVIGRIQLLRKLQNGD